MKKFSKILLLVLALTLSFTLLFACAPAEQVEENTPPTVDNKEEEKTPDYQILGKEGNIKFDFIVTHADGSKVTYKVETTKDNLGDALLEGSIVKGDVGEFGLYVTEVDGEEASWDKDQAYWYFYKGEEPLMEGVSSTPIENGDVFRAVYTK